MLKGSRSFTCYPDVYPLDLSAIAAPVYQLSSSRHGAVRTREVSAADPAQCLRARVVVFVPLTHAIISAATDSAVPWFCS